MENEFCFKLFPKRITGGGLGYYYPKVIALNYHLNQIKRPAKKKKNPSQFTAGWVVEDHGECGWLMKNSTGKQGG